LGMRARRPPSIFYCDFNNLGRPILGLAPATA
jgi:hypothetical protein